MTQTDGFSLSHHSRHNAPSRAYDARRRVLTGFEHQVTVRLTQMQDTPFVKSPKTRPQRSRPVIQAYALQDILFNAAHSDTITPSALAQVARAWCEVEQRKREIQMKPKPKPIDVSAPIRKPKVAAEFVEQPAPTVLPKPGN